MNYFSLVKTILGFWYMCNNCRGNHTNPSLFLSWEIRESSDSVFLFLRFQGLSLVLASRLTSSELYWAAAGAIFPEVKGQEQQGTVAQDACIFIYTESIESTIWLASMKWSILDESYRNLILCILNWLLCFFNSCVCIVTLHMQSHLCWPSLEIRLFSLVCLWIQILSVVTPILCIVLSVQSQVTKVKYCWVCVGTWMGDHPGLQL